MADWPSYSSLPLFVNSYGPNTGLVALRGGLALNNATPASMAWPAANQALYMPFSLQYPYPVNRVFWVNGSALGNMDFGLYGIDGARIYSTGSTAQSGASVPQYVTPATTFVLAAGAYYFALANDGTTNRVWGSALVTAELGRLIGMQQQATAFALPATTTFAKYASACVPVCGFTRTTTGH